MCSCACGRGMAAAACGELCAFVRLYFETAAAFPWLSFTIQHLSPVSNAALGRSCACRPPWQPRPAASAAPSSTRRPHSRRGAPPPLLGARPPPNAPRAASARRWAACRHVPVLSAWGTCQQFHTHPGLCIAGVGAQEVTGSLASTHSSLPVGKAE